MPGIRLVRPTERPPVEVDEFSRDPDWLKKLNATVGRSRNRVMGNRYWVFNDAQYGYRAAASIAKLMVGAVLIHPTLRRLDIGALPIAQGQRRIVGNPEHTVAYLALIVPLNVEFANDGSEEQAVEMIVGATNEDLAGLNSPYELPRAR